MRQPAPGHVGRRCAIAAGFTLFLAFAAFPAVLSTGPAAGAPGRQAERPKFYATEVVSDRDVLDPADCLGAPDGRYAQIQPGGEITLRLEERLFDLGTIVCVGETDIGVEGWFHVGDSGDERKDYAWIPFTPMASAPGMSKAEGFSFGSPYEGPSSTGGLGVDKIRIMNAGPKSLLVDAVVGYAPPR
jgi:hypothetical protein